MKVDLTALHAATGQTRGYVKNSPCRKKSSRPMRIAARLAQAYPEVDCPLEHQNHFQLLVAVILSAQCTDAAVNKVTPKLFRRFAQPEALAKACLADIEEMIQPLGLFHSKAKALKQCARQLVEVFGGRVPSSMKELTQLAGVGRKTANVILGHAFHAPSLAVDTHVMRLSRRLGLTRAHNPRGVERDLGALLPEREWTGFTNRLIIHGRRVCSARKPACARCVINVHCPARRDRSPFQ